MFETGKLQENEICPGLSVEEHAASLAMFTLKDQNYSKEDLKYVTDYFIQILMTEFENTDDMMNFIEDLEITLDPNLIQGLIAWKNGDVVEI